MAELTEDRVREIVREEIDAATKAQADAARTAITELAARVKDRRS